MKRTFIVITIFTLSVWLVGCSRPAKPANESKKVRESQTYFTRVNIWYEHPEKVLAINYQRGLILPVNTKVGIVKRTRNLIVFRDLSTNQRFTLINTKHTRKTSAELFKVYFSSTSIDLGRFSPSEQENIKNATVAVGMSKAAVVAACGYPPAHRTPSLNAELWTYWIARFRTRSVRFSGDTVAEVR